MTSVSSSVPTLRIAIIYSSLTGNTRSVAQALASASHDPLFSVTDAPDPDSFDILALGFWVRRAAPDSRSLRYWQRLHGKSVFYFGTLGAWPHSAHALRCHAACRQLLVGQQNSIAGSFLCQGRVHPRFLALSARKGTHPMTEERRQRLAEAALHPNETDKIAAVAAWQQARAVMLQQLAV